MKKILYAFLAIAVWYSGFPCISLAQNGLPANDAGQQKDIEQNMNDIIKRLDELQNDTETNLKRADGPVKKNDAEHIFETAKETLPSDPADPTRPSQPIDKFFAEASEIENNVNQMLKALEELQNSGKVGKESPLHQDAIGQDETGKIEEPNSLEHFVKPGDSLNPTGDPTKINTAGKSIEKTDEVVRLDPAGPDSHFQNGLVYWKSKNREAAILEFQEVVRLAPENAHAYWNLGLLYDESNRGPEAIANIKKAEGIYSKYNYSGFVEDARKHLKRYSEKYGTTLPE